MGKEEAWQRLMRPDQRDMKTETMNDDLDNAINNVVIEHAHSDAGRRAPLKVPMVDVKFLQTYVPARWKETLPWDCCCGIVGV